MQLQFHQFKSACGKKISGNIRIGLLCTITASSLLFMTYPVSASGSNGNSSSSVSEDCRTETETGKAEHAAAADSGKTDSKSLSGMQNDKKSQKDALKYAISCRTGASPQYLWVYDHADLFDEGKAEHEIRNDNADCVNFMFRYGHFVFLGSYGSDKPQTSAKPYASLTSSEKEQKVPALYQWDDRWGYKSLGSSVLGLVGCGPTSLAMALIALTGNTALTPDVVAQFADQNGYYVDNRGSAWNLFTEGAAHFGVKGRAIPVSEENIISELKKGHILIAGMRSGRFTTGGHILVIRDYMNGSFLINDPNSRNFSSRIWSYEELSSEMSNCWTLSKSE